MGLSLLSCGDIYILVGVDYVFKWIKVVALPTDDLKVLTKFLIKNILQCLAHLEPSLVIGELTFATNCLKLY